MTEEKVGTIFGCVGLSFWLFALGVAIYIGRHQIVHWFVTRGPAFTHWASTIRAADVGWWAFCLGIPCFFIAMLLTWDD